MVGHNNNVVGGNMVPTPSQEQRVGYMVPNPYDANARNTAANTGMMQPAQNPTFVHVQGEMEARVWPVANGYTAVLFDNDETHVYVKGPSGFVKYTRDDNLEEYPYQQVDLSGYVKTEDVQNMINDAISRFSETLQREPRANNSNNKKYNKNRGGNNYEKRR